METPFYCMRQMPRHLGNEGHTVKPKWMRRLLWLMPSYRCSNTSPLAKDQRPYPSLLIGLAIDRPSQVLRGDITYIPMRRGFLYRLAIVDWHSRRVLSGRLSVTLEAEFRVDARDEAIARLGPPAIMNTDQGSQFTIFASTNPLRKAGIRISRDAKGPFSTRSSLNGCSGR